MESLEQWITEFSTSFNSTIKTIIQYLPNILVAIVLIIVGWLLAKLFRSLILKTVKGFDRFYQTTWLKDKQEYIDRRYTLSKLIGELVFWLTLFVFIVLAIDKLGFEAISRSMRSLYAFIPNIVAGFLIIFVGYLVSTSVRVSIARFRVKNALLLSQVAWFTILLVAILLGLAQLGINIRLVTNLLTITIGAFLGGGAFAFGLGAANTVSNIIAAHYLKKAYEVGQTIKFDNMEGKIVELAPTAVVLSTTEGKAAIPAKQFNEQVVIVKD